jgi:uncharacterized glyoxalase superfamily protein PhnB
MIGCHGSNLCDGGVAANRQRGPEKKRTMTATDPPAGFPRILPHLIYDDVGAAIDWLTGVFGFRERLPARHVSPDGTIGRTQMEVVDSLITIGTPSIHGDSPSRGVSSMLYVYVDDVDDHHQRAKGAGATIVTELEDMPWGDRRYQTVDPEGHQWTFAQHLSDSRCPEAGAGHPGGREEDQAGESLP